MKKSHAVDDPGLGRAVEAVHLSPTQRALANVTTIQVRTGHEARSVHVVGVVDVAEPARTIVSSRVRGRVEHLHANVTGMMVRKGDELFEIYSPEVIAASQEYLLARDGSGGNEITDHTLTAARSKLQTHYGMTDAQIGALEKSGTPADQIVVYAPTAGIVVRKDVIEGMYVSEGTQLMELADLSSVWVWLDVYEQDAASVHVGQSVAVESDAMPGIAVRGRVEFIDPSVNATTRTVRVRATIANPQGQLRPRQFVRASIELPGHAGMLVPASAVLRTGTHAVVWVELSTGVFEPRDVQLGARIDGDYEVLGGLAEGESIAATGAFLIDSESQLSHPASVRLHDGKTGGAQ